MVVAAGRRGHRSEASQLEFDELFDDAELAESCGDDQDQIGRGWILGELCLWSSEASHQRPRAIMTR